ncbi:unnamed protein product [Diatraea saccharalis]|uniref:Uncharacterized protein n=1 Tax=Diatraea saccharalis TaxID=40085 RepID=A0A9N9R594_9NEOP|nr:unnamed protein product [Diatraea saccharalis]
MQAAVTLMISESCQLTDASYNIEQYLPLWTDLLDSRDGKDTIVLENRHLVFEDFMEYLFTVLDSVLAEDCEVLPDKLSPLLTLSHHVLSLYPVEDATRAPCRRLVHVLSRVQCQVNAPLLCAVTAASRHAHCSLLPCCQTDTSLIFNIDRNKYNFDDVNNALSRVLSWFTVNNLQLNAKKTKCIKFTLPNVKVEPTEIKLNNEHLELKLRVDKCSDEATLCECCFMLIQEEAGVDVLNVLEAIAILFTRGDVDPKILIQALRRLETIMTEPEELYSDKLNYIIHQIDKLRTLKNKSDKYARILHKDVIVFLGKYGNTSYVVEKSEENNVIAKLKDKLLLNIPNTEEGTVLKVNLQSILQLAIVHEEPDALHKLLAIICSSSPQMMEDAEVQLSLVCVTRALCVSHAHAHTRAAAAPARLLHSAVLLARNAHCTCALLAAIGSEKSPGARKMLSDALEGSLLLDPGSELTEQLIQTVADEAIGMMASGNDLSNDTLFDPPPTPPPTGVEGERFFAKNKHGSSVCHSKGHEHAFKELFREKQLFPPPPRVVATTRSGGLNVTESLLAALKDNHSLQRNILPNLLTHILETADFDAKITFQNASKIFIDNIDIYDEKTVKDTLKTLAENVVKTVNFSNAIDVKLLKCKVEETCCMLIDLKSYNYDLTDVCVNELDVNFAKVLYLMAEYKIEWNVDVLNEILARIVVLSMDDRTVHGDFAVEAALRYLAEYCDVLHETNHEMTTNAFGNIISNIQPQHIIDLRKQLNNCLIIHKKHIKHGILQEFFEKWCIKYQINISVEMKDFTEDDVDNEVMCTVSALKIYVKISNGTLYDENILNICRNILDLYVDKEEKVLDSYKEYLTDLLYISLKFQTIENIKKFVLIAYGKANVAFFRYFMEIFMEYFLVKPFILLDEEMNSIAVILKYILKETLKRKCDENHYNCVLELIEETWHIFDSISTFEDKYYLLSLVTRLPVQLRATSTPIQWAISECTARDKIEDKIKLVGVLPGGGECMAAYRSLASRLPARLAELRGTRGAAMRALLDALARARSAALLQLLQLLADWAHCEHTTVLLVRATPLPHLSRSWQFY